MLQGFGQSLAVVAEQLAQVRLVCVFDGLDEEAVRRRLAAGARVGIHPVEDSDESNLRELLGHYREALAESLQHAEAEEVARLAEDWRERFVKLVPKK